MDKNIKGGGFAYVANNLFPREYLNSYWRLVVWYISTAFLQISTQILFRVNRKTLTGQKNLFIGILVGVYICRPPPAYSSLWYFLYAPLRTARDIILVSPLDFLAHELEIGTALQKLVQLHIHNPVHFCKFVVLYG